MEIPTNLPKWFNANPSYFGYGEYFEGDTPPEGSLINLLGLEQDDLKDFTKDALVYFEQNERVRELKLGIRAYSQFQDILNLVVHDSNHLWNRHYCYYESLVYLRESAASWLDKNILAAMALLRPFLELAVLHVYWYLRCESNGYDNFYLWLAGKKEKPPFKNQVEYILANLPSKNVISSKRLKQIQHLLYNLFKGMSTYNHTPKIDESIVSLSGGIGQISLHSFFYYLANVTILLRQVVYLYILTYPMAMFPVDRYRKWGTGGPVGLYFDYNNFAVVKAYLGEDNIERIQKELKHLQEIRDMLEWFDSHADLNSAELEANWQDFLQSSNLETDAKDKGHRIAMHKAHSRAFGWFANYLHSPSNPDEEMSDEVLERVMKQVRNW